MFLHTSLSFLFSADPEAVQILMTNKQKNGGWIQFFSFFLAASVFILTPVISIIWTDENVMDEKPENAAFDTGFALTGNFRYFTA